MDPHLTPGPSSLSYYPALSPSYDELDDSASRSQARSHLGNIQSNELDESLNIRGSTFRPTHPSPLYGFEDLSIPHPSPNTPNHHQSMLFASPSHSSEVPFPMHPDNADDLRAAPTQYAYPAGQRGAYRQMEHAEIETHDCLSPPQGVSRLSAPPESLSTMTAGNSSSPSTESYTQSGAQNDYAAATSVSHRGTALSPVATQGQSATRKKQTKKEKDMVRKRVQRSDDGRHFARICELLEIPLNPKKTLVRRIQVGVEALVERCKLESERQCRIEEEEAGAVVLREELAQLSTQADATPFPPINVHTLLGDSGISATRVHGFGPMGRELDNSHI